MSGSESGAGTRIDVEAIDPGAHDRQTLHTLYALFDVVVTWEPATDDGGNDEGDDTESGGRWVLKAR